MATVNQLAENSTTLANTNATLVAAFLALKNAVPTTTVLDAADQAAVDAADVLVVKANESAQAALTPPIAEAPPVSQ